MEKDQVPERIRELWDKVYHRKATEEEGQEVLQYFRKLLSDYPEWQVGNMIYILHPKYGKPDENGIIMDI